MVIVMRVAPTFQKGLKRISNASFLQIIACVFAIIGLIIAFLGLSVAAAIEEVGVGSITGGLVTAASGAILLLVSGVLLLLAAILSMLGIINISKENVKFRAALLAVLIGIVFRITGFFAGSGTPLSRVLSLLAQIANIAMALYVCEGIRELGKKLERSDALGKYTAVFVFYVIAAILMCLGSIFGILSAGYLFRVAGYIFSIIAHRLYMCYIRKAIKVVKSHPTAAQS